MKRERPRHGNITKLSISLPNELMDWADQRSTAFEGKVSRYLASLVAEDKEKLTFGRQEFQEFRDEVVKELRAALAETDAKVEASPDIDAVVGTMGIETKLAFRNANAQLKMVKHLTKAVINHDLETIVLVLPDTCSDDDIINYKQLRGVVLDNFHVMRFSNFRSWIDGRV